MRPFNPSWLDDLGLTAQEFRVFLHLWRRADAKGVCWPGAQSITKTCRLSENTVWKVLRELEGRRLLTREKQVRNSNKYTLAASLPVTAKETVTDLDQSPQTERRLSPQTERCQSPQTERCQSPQRRGREGIPLKGIQGRQSSEGVAEPPHLIAPLTPEDRSRLARKVGVHGRKLNALLNTFARVKASYGDGPKTIVDFEDWLLSSTRGKQEVQFAKEESPAVAGGRAPLAGSTPPQSIPAPPDWEDVIANDPDDKSWVGREWGNIHPFYQERIAQKCAPSGTDGARGGIR